MRVRPIQRCWVLWRGSKPSPYLLMKQAKGEEGRGAEWVSASESAYARARQHQQRDAGRKNHAPAHFIKAGLGLSSAFGSDASILARYWLNSCSSSWYCCRISCSLRCASSTSSRSCSSRTSRFLSSFSLAFMRSWRHQTRRETRLDLRDSQPHRHLAGREQNRSRVCPSMLMRAHRR